MPYLFLLFAVIFLIDGIVRLSDNENPVLSFILSAAAIFMFFLRRRQYRRFNNRNNN